MNDGRFDRQLRLWGSSGQQRLERARICCIGLNDLAVELMKNLILAGVGAISCFSEQLTTEHLTDVLFHSFDDDGDDDDDEQNERGKWTFEELTRALQRLNPSVRVRISNEELSKPATHFQDFDIVAIAEWPGRLPIAEICAFTSSLFDRGIPVIACHVSGLVGSVTAQLRSHAILNTRPDFAPLTVHLHRPWPELLQLVDDYPSFAEMSDSEFSSVPYVVLLLRARQWSNPDDCPSSTEHLLDLVPSTRRHFANVIEALRYASRLWASDAETYSSVSRLIAIAKENDVASSSSPSSSSSSSTSLLASSSSSSSLPCPSTTIRECDRPFWQVVRALSDFHEAEGRYPVAQGLPDMEAATHHFVSLLAVYQARHKADCHRLLQLCRHRSQDFNLPSSASRSSASFLEEDEELIAQMCQQVGCLRHVATPSLDQMCLWGASTTKGWLAATITEQFPADTEADDHSSDNADGENFVHLLLAQACRVFFDCQGRRPSDQDAPLLSATVLDCLAAQQIDRQSLAAPFTSCLSRLAVQHCHSAGRQLYSTCAVVGGLASLEIIKILTRQWVPVLGPLLFNGARATTSVFPAK